MNDLTSRVIQVASGQGGDRNILAEPTVWVSCGLRRRAVAEATPMADDESAAALRLYAETHPKIWASLRATIEAAVRHPVDELPIVSLRLKPDHLHP